MTALLKSLTVWLQLALSSCSKGGEGRYPQSVLHELDQEVANLRMISNLKGREKIAAMLGKQFSYLPSEGKR